MKEQLGNDNIPRSRHAKLSDEEKKENRRKYYENHKEQLKSYSKSWNQKNKDKVAEYNKKNYLKKKLNQSTSLQDSPEGLM